jgi:hypothetical protein
VKTEIAYDLVPEGVIARVAVGEARFSFRVGKGVTSTSEVHGAYLWFVEESGRNHIVQMVLSGVLEEAIRSAVPHDSILISHMRWETEFQEQRLQRKLVHSGLGHFPTGEPYLVWGMEGEVGTSGNDGEKATCYSSNATTFHDGVIVLFGIQGFGTGWEDSKLLDLKCSRVMLSMFRHSSLLKLPLNTPTK